MKINVNAAGELVILTSQSCSISRYKSKKHKVLRASEKKNLIHFNVVNLNSVLSSNFISLHLG